VARTWALLIAAYILYLPANLLPMMDTNSLRGSQSDTILSGVVFLWTSGSWPLALVVFFASITVPMLKLFALTLLLVTTQRQSSWQPNQRTRLFRLVEFVGRWSMLDIFVVTILAALVQLKALATIKAGPAAAAFGAAQNDRNARSMADPDSWPDTASVMARLPATTARPMARQPSLGRCADELRCAGTAAL
jgi:paraquat-inducible protein A